MSYGDLDLHDHFAIFSLVETKVVPGRVQQPINALTTTWDDFSVHSVNWP